MKSLLTTCSLTLLIIMSCSKSNNINQTNGNYEYFPIDTNLIFEYEVDSISYNSNNQKIDTFLFYLKTQFTNSFLDKNGTKTYHLQRLAKYANSRDFVEISSHFVQFYENKYIYFETNLPLVKAVFPLSETTTWNINLYNNQSSTKSKPEFIDQIFTVADTSYQKSLKINENIEKDFIFETEQWSVYQKNVGLVYSKNKKTETQTNQSGNPIISGYDITQKLINVYR